MRVVLAGSFLQVTLWAFHCDLLTGIGTDTSSLLLHGHAKKCGAAWSTAKIIMRSVASLHRLRPRLSVLRCIMPQNLFGCGKQFSAFQIVRLRCGLDVDCTAAVTEYEHGSRCDLAGDLRELGR